MKQNINNSFNFNNTDDVPINSIISAYQYANSTPINGPISNSDSGYLIISLGAKVYDGYHVQIVFSSYPEKYICYRFYDRNYNTWSEWRYTK